MSLGFATSHTVAACEVYRAVVCVSLPSHIHVHVGGYTSLETNVHVHCKYMHVQHHHTCTCMYMCVVYLVYGGTVDILYHMVT